MAGDWIKMRVNLASDPAVIGMSIALGLDEDTVVGKLHRIWSWADQHTEDGHAEGVTAEWVDSLVGVENFSSLLEKQGWMRIKKSGITIPNFEVHNGKSAKTRALATKRKVTERSRKGHAPAVTKTGLEKRREREERKPTSRPMLVSHPKSDPKPDPKPDPLPYSGICREIETDLLGIPMNWRSFQVKKMEVQVARLGAPKVLEVVRNAAKGITAPGIKDRAQYALRIVEQFDPEVEAAQNAHWGKVTCEGCGATHKILMQIEKRKIWWVARGSELAIRCGCGQSVPTGKQMPSSYDATELKDMPTAIEEALGV